MALAGMLLASAPKGRRNLLAREAYACKPVKRLLRATTF